MFPASFGYFAPESLGEALDILSGHSEEAKLLAGGHSLIPAMKLRLASPRYLIDIGRLPGLRGVAIDGGDLAIGALTVHADIASSDIVRRHVPGLVDAASVIGDVQVRNRGTIGGSVAHADPAGDFPVILTALNASFVLESVSGRRTVAADEFFLDFFTTAMAANEILTQVRIPLPASGAGSAYVKLGHAASGYVVVSAGALLSRHSGSCESARIAVGGLGSSPIRAAAAELELQGKPLTKEVIAAAASKVIDGVGADVVEDESNGDYKRHMAAVYARRAIEAAAGRI